MKKRNWKRRLVNSLGKPLITLFIRLLWKTCRVVKVEGSEHAEQLLTRGKPFIPCYWHQQHIFCAYYLLGLQEQGLKLGFLISPSKDGDVPAQIIEKMGARAVRGSSTRTGARAIRDLYNVMAKEGISPVNTADGPTGPIFKFKPGAVMLAQLTGFPMLPMAYATDRAWQAGSWDRFIIPKPFSRIAITIGNPRYVDKKTGIEIQTEISQEMELSLIRLTAEAEKILK
jgi:lysophospholipid acyltransferase (LPLAT)-like uncharacterized protein